MYVLPCVDPVGRCVAIDARRPWHPVAVHLVGEAQVYRAGGAALVLDLAGISPVASVIRPLGDVVIKPSGSDVFEGVLRLLGGPCCRISWSPGHHGYRVSVHHGVHLRRVEMLPTVLLPVLVPHHYVRRGAYHVREIVDICWRVVPYVLYGGAQDPLSRCLRRGFSRLPLDGLPHQVKSHNGDRQDYDQAPVVCQHDSYTTHIFPNP